MANPMNKLTIDDLDLRGKRVFIRVDFNVPLKNGVITDDTRIRETLPTLRLAMQMGGRLVLLRYYKGLNCLIDSAKDVDGKVLVVGDGRLRGELIRAVQAKKLKDKVFFAGEVPDEELGSYYHAADLFVLPSSHKSEAFGISILEAMACGLPVISTELGTGTSYVNLHNKTGLVIPPGDSVALSRSINYLLQDKSLRDEFGRESRERAQKYFSKEIMVSRIKKLYIENIKS